MKVVKLILISAGMLFAFLPAEAQLFPSDLALSFSRTHTGGSARILGLGGVNNALGGDITNISSNPAGLGFYNRSEVSITPVINVNSNTTQYLGSSNDMIQTRFHIGNLGLVINNSKSDREPGAWKGGSFGFSYNRINDHHNEVFYSGTNETNDYIDFVLKFAESNEAEVDDFYIVDLPFFTYLINNFSVQAPGDTLFGVWDTYIQAPGPANPVRQSEEIKISGYQNKWDLSYGGNVNDRFYFGLGLGIITLNYENEKRYKEERSGGSILDQFILNERQVVDGVGVNANFGIIVRPVNTLTVGLNYTTPSAYSMTDEFETSLSSLWADEAFDFYGDDPNFTGDHTERTELSPLTYTITTPMRVSGGVAYFFNKNGFLSGDVEWVDYSSAKVRSNDVDFSLDNEEINEFYTSTLNYRIGGEYRLDIFRFRAGFNYQAGPMAGESQIDMGIQTYSAGFGIRKRSFYTDFAFLYSNTGGTRAPYTLQPSWEAEVGQAPVARIDYNQYRMIFTAGFTF